MYKISQGLAEYLVAHAADPKFAPLGIMEPKPFVAKNSHSIGFMDPVFSMGTDYDFIVEFPFFVVNPTMGNISTDFGFWLYRREELRPVAEEVSFLRHVIDINVSTEDTEKIDLTGCCVRIPSSIEKFTCTMVSSLERLLELEPALNDCLAKED